MAAKPIISVTVPVYNTSKYIRQCLDSLSAQTFEKIEFILVDDGSTDDSGVICDEYASRDSRFRVIHQKNKGTAGARQAGLDDSNGEYITICDSDDWVEPNIYTKLYALAKETQADMVICDFYYNYPDGRQTVAKNIPTGCDIESLTKDVLMRRIAGATWNKLIRKNLFEKYKLYWEEGINLGEDVFMFLKLLQYDIKVTSIDEPYYHYRRLMNANTLTNNLTVNSFNQAEYIHNWKKNNIDATKFVRELFHSTLDYAYIGIRVKGMPSNTYRAFVKTNLPYKNFFKYRVFTPKSVLIFSSKILGLRFAQWINRLLYKLWYK